MTLSIFRNIATQNLLRPVDTRFATHYIALKRLVEQKNALRSLVGNPEWKNNILAKGEHGKMLENTMFNQSFWLWADKIVSICEPIVKVLSMVDSDDACIGFIYECIDRTEEHIANACDNDQSQYR